MRFGGRDWHALVSLLWLAEVSPQLLMVLTGIVAVRYVLIALIALPAVWSKDATRRHDARELVKVLPVGVLRRR